MITIATDPPTGDALDAWLGPVVDATCVAATAKLRAFSHAPAEAAS
jgi:hypothetical protein